MGPTVMTMNGWMDDDHDHGWLMMTTYDDHRWRNDGQKAQTMQVALSGPSVCFFFSISIPTCYIKYNIWMYTCTKKVGPNWLRLITVQLQLNRLRLVEKPIETSMDWSLAVPVQFLDFLRIRKPVLVAVAPKKGKKLDQTRLLNTTLRDMVQVQVQSTITIKGKKARLNHPRLHFWSFVVFAKY